MVSYVVETCRKGRAKHEPLGISQLPVRQHLLAQSVHQSPDRDNGDPKLRVRGGQHVEEGPRWREICAAAA